MYYKRTKLREFLWVCFFLLRMGKFNLDFFFLQTKQTVHTVTIQKSQGQNKAEPTPTSHSGTESKISYYIL
jgi:hypothetical protein